MSTNQASWQNFKDLLFTEPQTGFSLDISRMQIGKSDFEAMKQPFAKAFEDMEALEKGSIANPSENRMVGHYWLRNSKLAPTADITAEINNTFNKIVDFAAKVHEGYIRPQRAERFTKVLSIGIGGSALGPEFVSQALRQPDNPLKIHFFDNTDPDGISRVLDEIGNELHRTLVVVISKSGSTKETRNGMLEAQNAFDRAGLTFAQHAVAITGEGSHLYKQAKAQQWLEIFPMWDWVGGRTSELSAVGLLPAALQGFDIDAIIKGAAFMDMLTRSKEIAKNPAALLALCWYIASSGKGKKDMVILPYCDRLELFGRYLQQLIMESLGKEKDLNGDTVHQGLSVYGNKGSTDQHAYVQQLRDGVDNFFVTFIAVLKNTKGPAIEVEEGITTGDFLSGFWQGTREALTQSQRRSMLITVPEINPFTIGMLIGLYERAVGFYASLININAYDQPGVEGGKKAAGVVLSVQAKILELLTSSKDAYTAEEMAKALGMEDKTEMIFHIAQHLAANFREDVVADGPTPNASFKVDHRKAWQDSPFGGIVKKCVSDN